MLRTCIDLVHPARPEWHVDHLAATCNIIYILSLPVDAEGEPTIGDMVDISGWGGDWVSLFGDWVAAGLAPTSSNCKTYLAESNAKGATVPDFISHMRLRDVIEDVDAYYVAMRVRTFPDAAITEEFGRWYGIAAQHPGLRGASEPSQPGDSAVRTGKPA